MSARIANLGYLVLFPGFFLYHFAKSLGVPLPANGLFGSVSALIFLYAVSFGAMNWVRIVLRSPFAFGLAILLIWCATVTATNWYFFDPPPGTVKQSVETIVLWIALATVAAWMNIDAKWFRTSLWFGWAAVALIVFFYRDGASFVPQGVNEDDVVTTYQGFARSAQLTSLILMALLGGAFARIGFSIICLVVVYWTAARSELYGMLAAIVIIETCIAITRLRHVAILIALVGLATCVIAYNWEDFSQSRQLQVFSLDKSESWNNRMELRQRALDRIAVDPLMGYFGGHALKKGPFGAEIETETLGEYAHDALSAWVNYGIFGFALYATLIIYAAGASLYGMIKKRDRWWRFAAYVNVSCLILVLLAEPVFWPVTALGWGAYIAAKHRKRQDS